MLNRRQLIGGLLAVARPEGVLVDTHVHLFATDQKRFPYHPSATYKPPAQPLEDYLKFAAARKIDHTVIVHPDPEQESAYRKLQREFVDLRGKLAENRDRPARTADGVELTLLANINGVDDAQAAGAMGASGVGLYRTEYLFLSHPSVPSEEEQFENYRAIIAAAPNKRVTIQTLDIGGDKSVPFLRKPLF